MGKRLFLNDAPGPNRQRGCGVIEHQMVIRMCRCYRVICQINLHMQDRDRKLKYCTRRLSKVEDGETRSAKEEEDSGWSSDGSCTDERCETSIT